MDRRRRRACPKRRAPSPGSTRSLRTQDDVAQRLRARRHAQGSLELETFQPRAVFDGERVVEIRQQVQNRARQLIEEFMIATNECTAHFLAAAGGASLRRVVRSPERWLRIVEVARKYGETPAEGARLASRSKPSWPSVTGPTRCAFPISRWSSSS